MVFFVPLKLFNGDHLLSELNNQYKRSAHVDLGSSIAAEDEWYVRLPSYTIKWKYKLVTLNSLGY